METIKVVDRKQINNSIIFEFSTPNNKNVFHELKFLDHALLFDAVLSEKYRKFDGCDLECETDTELTFSISVNLFLNKSDYVFAKNPISQLGFVICIKRDYLIDYQKCHKIVDIEESDFLSCEYCKEKEWIFEAYMADVFVVSSRQLYGFEVC